MSGRLALVALCPTAADDAKVQASLTRLDAWLETDPLAKEWGRMKLSGLSPKLPGLQADFDFLLLILETACGDARLTQLTGPALALLGHIAKTLVIYDRAETCMVKKISDRAPNGMMWLTRDVLAMITPPKFGGFEQGATIPWIYKVISDAFPPCQTDVLDACDTLVPAWMMGPNMPAEIKETWEKLTVF